MLCLLLGAALRPAEGPAVDAPLLGTAAPLPSLVGSALGCLQAQLLLTVVGGTPLGDTSTFDAVARALGVLRAACGASPLGLPLCAPLDDVCSCVLRALEAATPAASALASRTACLYVADPSWAAGLRGLVAVTRAVCARALTAAGGEITSPARKYASTIASSSVQNISRF